MISCDIERSLEKSNIVSSEIFEEPSCDDNLSSDLRPAFWHNSLSKFSEKVMNFWFSHVFGNLEENVTIHVVPVDVFDGIMKSPGGDFPLRSSEVIELFLISLADMNESVTIERIEDGGSFF